MLKEMFKKKKLYLKEKSISNKKFKINININKKILVDIFHFFLSLTLSTRGERNFSLSFGAACFAAFLK